MTKIVRTLGIGRCSLLGELIDETETRTSIADVSAMH
jgi:hypothetical protein